MATALIFAGGTGLRMNSKTKPKQFLKLRGKSILLYTIEHFERHSMIDRIVVVCLKEWIQELKMEINRNNISKVKLVVEGGVTGFESIYNGLTAMKEVSNENDIVLIHDGVRPLISEGLISNNIEVAKKYGTAITVDYARETIIKCSNDLVEEVPNREEIRIAKAPQTFRFGNIYSEYNKAYKSGESYTDSCQLMKTKGYELHTVYSTEYNIKITTPVDFYIFKGILDAQESSQIFGLD